MKFGVKHFAAVMNRVFRVSKLELVNRAAVMVCVLAS